MACTPSDLLAQVISDSITGAWSTASTQDLLEWFNSDDAVEGIFSVACPFETPY